MTKQAVIAIVVGVIIILGAAGAFLYSQNKPKESASTSTSQIETEATITPNNSMAQSITDIFSSSENTKCTFSSSSDNGKTDGTIFVSGENAKAEISVTTDGKKSNTNMIKNDETFYMWGDAITTGIKMTIKADELEEKIQESDQLDFINPEEKMDFKCVAWTPDEKLFTPPTNVRFISFEGMMPSNETTTSTITPSGSSSQEDNTNECNICNSLTGAAKTACIAQFKCQ